MSGPFFEDFIGDILTGSLPVSIKTSNSNRYINLRVQSNHACNAKEHSGVPGFTLGLDGWTDTSKRSLVEFLVMRSDKPSLLIDLVELSEARHTADTYVDQTIVVLKQS